jgi:hypothetical protein
MGFMRSSNFFYKLIQNPFVIVGLILCYLLYAYMDREGFFKKRHDSLVATSCKSVRYILEKRQPENWQIQCENNQLNLVIEVLSEIKDSKLNGNPLRASLYRELANTLSQVAKLSAHIGLKKADPLKKEVKSSDKAVMNIQSSREGIQEMGENESLARTPVVRLKLIHKLMTINALTEGRHLSKLTTLTNPKFVANHIQQTVQVQEVPGEGFSDGSPQDGSTK